MGERFDMSRPIYAQIVERLKAKILAGVYPPGGHLDSVRDMAAAAGVNPNTMQRALAKLEAEGLVYTERTTGRFVTEDTALLEQLRDETARAMTAEYLEKMRGIGYGPAEAAKLMTGWETKESDSSKNLSPRLLAELCGAALYKTGGKGLCRFSPRSGSDYGFVRRGIQFHAETSTMSLLTTYSPEAIFSVISSTSFCVSSLKFGLTSGQPSAPEATSRTRYSPPG